MSMLTSELEQAVRRCAVLRARLMPWVEIAAELHVPPDVLEQWQWQHRAIWRPAYDQEGERLRVELVKEIDKELEELRKERPALDACLKRRKRRREHGRKDRKL